MTIQPPLPEHIGPYRVTGHLGRGGMGEVLRGHDDRLDRPVALKRIRPDARSPEKALKRFRREARVLARLSHPAIVQVYDWEESEGQHWLVMELVDGRLLADLIAQGPLPVGRAVAIARQVAAGLATAHELGLVHRDLKASNVIVTEIGGAALGQVKILDFGLAKAVAPDEGGRAELKTSTLTGDGQVVGTLTAMSPEQALGRPVDFRSDLFALGTLFYEMLSGVSPFKGEGSVETLTRICTAKQRPLHRLDPEIPAGLSRLVGELLEKEPAHRPSSTRLVVAELERLSGNPDPAPDGEALVSQGTTLFENPAVALVDDSEELVRVEAPGSSRRLGRGSWLAAVGLVIGVGLWGFLSWMGSLDEEGLAVHVSTTNAETPEANLTSYELYRRGTAYLERPDRKGNIDKAIVDFQRALVIDEDYAAALAGLASAYLVDFYRGSQDPQRLEQALAAGERAVEVDGHLAACRSSLGRVYAQMGRFEDAVRELEKALELEPSNSDAWCGLGKVSQAQGDLEQAEEHFLRAIAIKPDKWQYHTDLGELYYRAGRYEEAAASFLRQLEITPDDFLAWSNLGATYYMQGRLSEAATQFQKALQIKPDSGIYANVGTIYFTQGLYAQSVSAFEKAITSGGSNDYLLWGNLGDACRWAPGYEAQAREAYLRAVQLLGDRLATNPDNPTLRTRWVLYLAKRGDCEEALTKIEKLGDLPGDDGSAWFRRAVASEICDQRDDALQALEVALEARFSIEEVRRDPELLGLRQDVRYHRLEMQFQSDDGR